MGPVFHSSPPLLPSFDCLFSFLDQSAAAPSQSPLSSRLYHSFFIPYIPDVSKCSILESFFGIYFVLVHSGFHQTCPPSDLKSSYIPAQSFSGSLWSSVARQVLHCVAKAIFHYDAVHRGLGHPQLLPYGPLRLAVLPEVHHALPLPHVVLLGLLADTGSAWPSPGSAAGFCGGRQAADCSGGRRDTLVAP